MRKQPVRTVAFLLCVLLAGLNSPARGAEGTATQGSGEAESIAIGLLGDADAERLRNQKISLDTRREMLTQQMKAFNADCANVPQSDTRKISDCGQRHQELRDRISGYRTDLQSYKDSLKQLIDRELSRTEERIQETRKILETFSSRLKDYQASLDTWASLPVEAREKAHQAALDNVATFGLHWLSERKARDLKLSKDMLDRVDGLIKGKILNQPYLERLPELRGRVLKRLETAKTDSDIVEVLTDLKTGIDNAGAVTEGIKDREEALSGLLTVITLVAQHPQYELLAAGGQLVIADVYAYASWGVSSKRIDQLFELGDAQLRELNSLTRLYKADIDKRLLFLRARKELTTQ